MALVSTLCGVPRTVEQMRDSAISCGARVQGGTNMIILANYTAIPFKPTQSVVELSTALSSGKVAIINSGGGVFSTGGHYLVALRMAGERVVLFDPNLYAGKYDKPNRTMVTVKGALITAPASVVAADCANRNPSFYIF